MKNHAIIFIFKSITVDNTGHNRNNLPVKRKTSLSFKNITANLGITQKQGNVIRKQTALMITF